MMVLTARSRGNGSLGAFALAAMVQASPVLAQDQAPPLPPASPAPGDPSPTLPNAPSTQETTGLPTADTDAPPNQAGTLTDIIVTAQKRAESISKAPIAVSAVGQQALDRLGGNTLEAVLRTVPNLNATTNGLSIRGLGGTNIQGGAGVGTVAMHVDGIYTIDTYPPSYDIDRIEVLRGPQGTLYGRNSTAGVVNVITAKPVDDLTGTADLGVGQYGRMTARAMINVPISDTLQVRASGVYDRDDGKQFYPGDGFAATGAITPAKRGDQTYRMTGRVALRWLPVDGLEWNVNATYDRDKGLRRILVPGFYANFPNVRQPVTVPVTISPQLPPVRLIVAPGAQDVSSPIVYPADYPRTWAFQPAGSDRIGGFADRNRDDIHIFAARSNLAYDLFDDLRASYLFGYRRERNRGRRQTVPYAESDAYILIKEWSHELNLNYEGERLRGVLGGYSFLGDTIADTYTRVWRPSVSTDATAPFAPPVLSPAVSVGTAGKNERQRTVAVFGQLTFDLTDRFRLTGGARYNWDKVDFSAYTTSLCPFGLGTSNDNVDPTGACRSLAGLPAIAYAAITGRPITRGQLTGAEPFPADLNPFTPGRAIPAAEISFEKFSWKATAEFDFTPDVLGYATVATGYKAGGVGDQTQTGDARFYAPETDINYEVGIRSKLFGNRVNLNLTGFWTDYDDLQVPVIRLIAGNPRSVLENAAASRTRGVEFEFAWAITPEDRLSGYATYLDAKVIEYANVQDVVRNTTLPDINGNRLGNAPEFTVRGVYSRIFDLGSAGTLTPTLQGQYQTTAYTTYLNNIEQRIAPYFTGDVSLRYETANRLFYVEGIVTNVTDENFVQSDFPVNGGGIQLLRYNVGRIWSARVGVKF